MEIRFEGVGGSDFEIESPQDRALKQFFVRAFQFLAMPRPKKSDAEKAARGTLQKCRMNGRTIPVAKDRLSEEPPVVVLGQTGKNFAAGMTGGVAYVLDENWDFYQRVNKETVSLEPVEHKYDVAALKELIREHVEATGSPRGKEILDNFSEYLPKFKKVLPYDYDRMLRVIASMEERGLDGEQAQIEAFYAVQKKK